VVRGMCDTTTTEAQRTQRFTERKLKLRRKKFKERR